MLQDKRILITGVLTKGSIAFAAAEQAQLAGADVILTGFGRARSLTERAAKRLPRPADVVELDVSRPEDLAALQSELRTRWDGIDGVLHAIAFAPRDALGGNFMSAPKTSATAAFEISAFSLKDLTAALLPLFGPGGGSVVGLDFDARVAWPVYDWMGVAKAALESVSRYLARDLGPRGIRVNLVSAGPVRTTAAEAIPGFDELADCWGRQAPLGWDVTDAQPVARTVCFLLSDDSRGVTGETIHVDGGYHAMGAPVVPGYGAAVAETVNHEGAATSAEENHR